MRSAVPRFRTPAAPWAMMRSPRRTTATMPKRSLPVPSIDCRMASTLTGALSSSDKPAGLNALGFDASIMFNRGQIGLGILAFHKVDVVLAGECLEGRVHGLHVEPTNAFTFSPVHPFDKARVFRGGRRLQIDSR